MDERAKWESRYQRASEPVYGREPSEFLVRSLPLLPPPGRCLDVAGGEGRNAVFLARQGWQVVLLDVAIAGLARARALGRAGGAGAALVAGDSGALPLRPGGVRFDLVLVTNFHDRELVAAAGSWLAPGGALVVEGFSLDQLGRQSGGPPDPALLWKPNELLRLPEGLRVVWYEDRLVDGDDNPCHRGPKWVVRLVARRPA
jgi:SAM-dependent methyltransferase